jgi:3D (Asp-Asp-Asp) domain-containing protein
MRNPAKFIVLTTLCALSAVFLYSQRQVGAAFLSQENVSVLQQVEFNQQDDKSRPRVIKTEDTKVEPEIEPVEGFEPDPEGAVSGESASKAMSFSATCYCLKGRTATGAGVRRGIVAADPRILPLGTRISISGSSHSGTYLVADTGGVIKGRIIDIWVPSCAEAIRFGRKRMSVSVLGKGGKKSGDSKKVKSKTAKKVKSKS